MLIPSIDLMDGKIVQLVQGKKKALEFDNFTEWIERFKRYSLIQLIDLDAAIGSGNNHVLLKQFLGRLPCQVGGGIRSVQNARDMLAAGAHRIIIGSTLIRDGKIDIDFAQELSNAVGPQKLVFAIDSRSGHVAIKGWREVTTISPLEMIASLSAYCDAFLFTNVETEGMMQGIPLDLVRPLRAATSKQLIAAGGISTQHEIDELHAMGVDAVVGMAVYTGKLALHQPERSPSRLAN